MELGLFLDGQEIVRFEAKGSAKMGDITKAENLLNGAGRERFKIRPTGNAGNPYQTFAIEDKEGESDVWLIGDCLASRFDDLTEQLDSLQDRSAHEGRLTRERDSVKRLLDLFWPKCIACEDQTCEKHPNQDGKKPPPPQVLPTYDPTPVKGYHDGLIKSVHSPSKTTSGNLFFQLDGEIYDVHPFREDLGGYPVRWHESADSYFKQGYVEVPR